jgi:hypothetical protein
VSDTVGGPRLHAICRSAAVAAPPSPYLSADAAFRPPLKPPLKKSGTGISARAHRGRLFDLSGSPARCLVHIGDKLERKLLHVSVLLCLAGSLGLCWPVIAQLRSTLWVSSAEASIDPPVSRCQRFSRCHGKAEIGVVKLDPFSSTTYAPSVKPHVIARVRTHLGRESAAGPMARTWSRLHKRSADRGRAAAKRAASQPMPRPRPSVRLASLEDEAPPVAATRPRVPSSFGTLTSLEDFETAPFPYHGMTPASDRPFLNVGTDGHWGHVNFRGEVLWESETFNDDRVLLHIPSGFDPRRPAVMVVFFHGHGANLAQDVLYRQQVPEQITAAGVNAVLVAPQFAVNAADSSAGKFWEPNGFRRFLDEAAVKLARMYGDQRTAFTFARMPIVIVAYSGGFAPTLSVLERGGVRSRVRGLVLLDALYGGTGKFADWIADNRSSFFVSSYTPHTAHRNTDLEHLLRKRSVPYSSQLRNSHLQGMVTFLPAGDVSHRDFVTHAWADSPIKDILLRMDDSDLRIETASVAGSNFPATLASRRN